MRSHNSIRNSDQREADGVLCTVRNADGDWRTIRLDSARSAITELDSLPDGPWQVQAMSTPDSIFTDLCGREMTQSGTPFRLERNVSATRPDLVHPMFAASRS